MSELITMAPMWHSPENLIGEFAIQTLESAFHASHIWKTDDYTERGQLFQDVLFQQMGGVEWTVIKNLAERGKIDMRVAANRWYELWKKYEKWNEEISMMDPLLEYSAHSDSWFHLFDNEMFVLVSYRKSMADGSHMVFIRIERVRGFVFLHGEGDVKYSEKELPEDFGENIMSTDKHWKLERWLEEELQMYL